MMPGFAHSPQLLHEFPHLAVATLRLDGVTDDVDVTATAGPFHERARARLAGGAEGGFPEIEAWRRAFGRLGLKPTQYRCASEALLRRFRKDDALPAIHPLVDLCNAVSMAYAIPIAVFDLDRVAGDLEVRHADGTERYESFGGAIEHPEPGELVFADTEGNAHARRWTNRQSARSAIRPGTRRVLIVCEALHDTAQQDVAALRRELEIALARHWPPVA
jgi:DNA/RNA-binding domain of Phe-tRNA-synthetase-like protein